MYKLSVIVPIFGVEKYIDRCVDSLFDQKLDSIEYIFIDDCTLDNSIKLLETKITQFTQRFEYMNWAVRIERMPTNSGVAAVRKYGVDIAQGDFVIHCDSDDWIHPDMYKVMYDEAINETADVVICDFNVTDGLKILRNIHGCSSLHKDVFIEQILLQKDSWSLCNKMFKRMLYYKTSICFPVGDMGEDFVLTIQLLLNSNKFTYVPQAFYNYFFNTNSITKVRLEEKKMTNFRINKENSDIIYRILGSYGLEERYSKAIVSNKWYIKKQLLNTDFDKAKRKLWKETYKEANSKILTNPHITLKDKVKFILTTLCLYPKRSKN